MLWANVNGVRMRAFRKGWGICPECGKPMIGKCGEIVTPHWAHRADSCTGWQEPESEWHRDWKARFPAKYQEVPVRIEDKVHIADVKTTKLVAEFQASPLATGHIRSREVHYDEMVWVLKADEFRHNLTFRQKKPHYWNLEWKRPRQSWWAADRVIFLDLGPDWATVPGLHAQLFWIKALDPRHPSTGWGHWMGVEEFVRRASGVRGSRGIYVKMKQRRPG